MIIRDILKMLLDKASSLKNMLNDAARMRKIMTNLRRTRQAEVNIKLENITGFLQYISNIILLDFKGFYQELGIKKSPIANEEKLLFPIRNEEKAFETDARIFNDMVDFYRDCMDCFFIQLRQKRQKLFDENTSRNLIKAISESRYSIGKLYEEYLMHEKINEEKVVFWRNLIYV